MMKLIVLVSVFCLFSVGPGAAFAGANKAPVPVQDNEKNFCTLCHAGGKSAAQAASAKGKDDMAPFVLGMDRKIADLGSEVEFLASKQVDIAPIKSRLDAEKRLFHRFVHEFSREEMGSTKNLLETEVLGLDKEIKSKISLLRHLDILYIAALGFNLLIITGILIYALAAYARRKDSVM